MFEQWSRRLSGFSVSSTRHVVCVCVLPCLPALVCDSRLFCRERERHYIVSGAPLCKRGPGCRAVQRAAAEAGSTPHFLRLCLRTGPFNGHSPLAYLNEWAHLSLPNGWAVPAPPRQGGASSDSAAAAPPPPATCKALGAACARGVRCRGGRNCRRHPDNRRAWAEKESAADTEAFHRSELEAGFCAPPTEAPLGPKPRRTPSAYALWVQEQGGPPAKGAWARLTEEDRSCFALRRACSLFLLCFFSVCFCSALMRHFSLCSGEAAFRGEGCAPRSRAPGNGAPGEGGCCGRESGSVRAAGRAPPRLAAGAQGARGQGRSFASAHAARADACAGGAGDPASRHSADRAGFLQPGRRVRRGLADQPCDRRAASAAGDPR